MINTYLPFTASLAALNIKSQQVKSLSTILLLPINSLSNFSALLSSNYFSLSLICLPTTPICILYPSTDSTSTGINLLE